MSKWIAGILIMTVVLMGGAAWAHTHDIPGPEFPPGDEVAAWKLVKGAWVSIGGFGAEARCFSSKPKQDKCNQQIWEIPVKVHASVTQWVEWSLSGTQWTWLVRKPGTYAANCISATLKSNYDVDIKFDGFNDLEVQEPGKSVNPFIPIYYAYGPGGEGGGPPPPDAFIPAEELNGLDCLVPDSERLHEGRSWKLWNYIEVLPCNSACEYQDDATITIELKGVKIWIDPESGYFIDYTYG